MEYDLEPDRPEEIYTKTAYGKNSINDPKRRTNGTDKTKNSSAASSCSYNYASSKHK